MKRTWERHTSSSMIAVNYTIKTVQAYINESYFKRNGDVVSFDIFKMSSRKAFFLFQWWQWAKDPCGLIHRRKDATLHAGHSIESEIRRTKHRFPN